MPWGRSVVGAFREPGIVSKEDSKWRQRDDGGDLGTNHISSCDSMSSEWDAKS